MEAANYQAGKILIVDDERSHSDVVTDVLMLEGYSNIRSLTDPRGVLSILLEWQPDLVILDLVMPYVDGFQVLGLVASVRPENDYLPILVNTANDTPEHRERALSSGAVDFLRKPFNVAELTLRVGNLLRFRLQYRGLQEDKRRLEDEILQRTTELEANQLELKEAQLETINRLARAAEHHDRDTAQHTERVAVHCGLLAQVLGLAEEQVTLLRQAAPLHDVGKIGITDSILLKPGIFTEAEFKVMQKHTVVGADLLAGGHSDLLRAAERIALTHHEKWDGSGYPRGLHRNGIDVFGRILAVADVFDALTHVRPYKRAWTIAEAVAEIVTQRGKHFDPRVVDAFMELPHEELL